MSDPKFVILGKELCPWCNKAEALLESKGFKYKYIDVTAYQIIKDFLKACGLNTVPQVYMNGDLIGGYEDLVEHLRLHDNTPD